MKFGIVSPHFELSDEFNLVSNFSSITYTLNEAHIQFHWPYKK